MKTNTTSPIVPNPTPATIATGGFTLGLDLGDRSHHVCVLDAAGMRPNHAFASAGRTSSR